MFRNACYALATLIALGFVFYIAPKQSAAQPGVQVDPLFFQGLRYRLVGPSRGGRVTTVTGVPSQPKIFYMYTTCASFEGTAIRDLLFNSQHSAGL